MALGRVHHLLGDEVVLDIADSGGPGVADLATDGEVLEVVVPAGQDGEAPVGHAGSRFATRFVRRYAMTRSPRWLKASVCHVTMPTPARLCDVLASTTVE